MSIENETRMELLGQKIPLNAWFFASLLAILCFLAFIEFNGGRGEASKFIGRMAGAFNEDGQLSKSSDLISYRFWTPSENTWNETSESDKKTIIAKGRENWYQTDKKEIQEFTKALTANNEVTGYRGYNRYVVYGAGTSDLKPGWKWNVTFLKSGKFSIADLTKMYSKHFHRNELIYIEQQFISAERHNN